MNFIDRFTERFRARFVGKVDGHEEVEPTRNRRSLRDAGIQGRRGGIQFKDGQVLGQARGKFLGPGRRPSILVSNAPGWQMRMFDRIDRQSARSRRTIRRMRAAGEIT